MSTRTIIGTALLLPVVVVVFFILNASDPKTGSVRMGSKPAEAACTKPAPDCLKDVSFKDTYDEMYPPEALQGKVVVVNFWATWCRPCKTEIPAFNRVYEKYKDRGVLMFGILQEDLSPADLLNFASDHAMTYPIVRLDEEIARRMGVPGNLPTTYVYDRQGSRRVNQVGALDERELEGYLDQLLAE
jgi:thiol-disulfide isomerase/thioredoxin